MREDFLPNFDIFIAQLHPTNKRQPAFLYLLRLMLSKMN